MKAIDYATLLCLAWHLQHAGAMLVGRHRAPFFSAALSNVGASSPDAISRHHRHQPRRYSLNGQPSSSLLNNQPIRGGGNGEVGGSVDFTTDVADDYALSKEEKQLQQNTKYIKGLLENLEGVLDKWIISGSLATRRRAYNIMEQIKRLAMDPEQVKQARRMVKRSGMPTDPPPPVPPTEHIPADQQPSIVDGTDLSSIAKLMGPMSSSESTSCGSTIQAGKSFTPTTYDGENRINLANERLEWEKKHSSENSAGNDGVGDARLSGVVDGKRGLDPFNFAADKQQLQETMKASISLPPQSNFQKSINNEIQEAVEPTPTTETPPPVNLDFASAKASELVARAGSGTAFQGSTLGIGGLDDVLSQIQRRVWIPLAAPPSLLQELGIQPVRGLLLYGSPGCGKTLLARKLGSILSPARPITIVSGPEIMDKFVGSSEKNLREIFDNPPDLYFEFKKNYGEPLAKTALHVIVLDEFDAIARTRGGSGGKGDQGDAGVARDSVVNQLLAKMDGVDPLSVPTLLIGLTNKPSLIDPALMRPGRFEVKVEVPKPKTVEQRASILKVHMESMMKSGRVLVRDAPIGTASWRLSRQMDQNKLASYDELVDLIAVECDGMSGASLAGVARAAASRALERAVSDFAGHVADVSHGDVEMQSSINDCLVTQEDFEKAVDDVFESARAGEYEEKLDSDTSSEKGSDMTAKSSDELKDESAATTGLAELSDDLSSDAESENNPFESEQPADLSINPQETQSHTDESQHETVSEYFRQGVDIPNWSDRRVESSSSLRDLLPKRKTTWLKLDKFGRRIEDTGDKR